MENQTMKSDIKPIHLVYTLIFSIIIGNLINVKIVGQFALTIMMFIIAWLIIDYVENEQMKLFLTDYELESFLENLDNFKKLTEDTYTLTVHTEGCVCNVTPVEIEMLENVVEVEVINHSEPMLVNHTNHEVHEGDIKSLRHHFIMKKRKRKILGECYTVYCATTMTH